MDTILPRPARAAAVTFIFVTILIDILAFGIIIPVLPHLIEEMAGGGVSRAAWWVGVFATVFAAIQFFCAPIQGALSDRFGRRPVILLSNLGLGLDFIFMALAPSVWLLMVGRIISGITSASYTTATAYIADTTPPEKRAGVFGLMGGAFALGFIVGPALGGLLGEIDLRLPFWVAAVLALLNFLYGLFILPESLPPEKRAKRFEPHSAHPIGALKMLRRHREVAGLAIVIFLFYLAHYVLQTVFVLYADFRYAWGPQAVGLVLGLVGISDGVVQAVLTGRLTARFGERPVLLAGMCFGVVAFLIFGLAPTGWMFLVGIPIMSLWGLAGPQIQALMTRHVAHDEQGKLQGAIASLGSFAGIFGPFLFAQIFAYWISPERTVHLPGFPFLLAASLVAVGIVVAARATRTDAVAVTEQ
ncbi:TCR/Tet family MFS transporter [Luteibacter anthropi]|uniref:TCR/Tet family MFS transporter n=1 Tax=Luteibacter anthropi TaxID=564369 RepID=A0A7X5ZKB7_9GAMM|nr:TCR/Tet family MFS transporter [Luteibacter anthropi]NII08734.1 TCR/Tet family MFS transporter [Luteibacter anthropi]